MKKEFRFDLEKTKEHLNRIFPDEKVREVYLKSISECAKIAAKENNTNWNVNLSNDFIRVNCGARYIFNMKAENIRVMCWRDSFLKLDRNFINDFLDNVFFYREDTKELLSSSYNPKTYEDLVSIPANILWHNSLQFNIAPRLWAEKYAEKLMPSVLDFCKDCIKHSSIMTQMQQAHSTGLIELINEEMKMNLVQPQYSNKYKSNLQGDTQMTQENSLVKKYANLLKNTKNIILTGAPGTGKTFMAKQIAKELGCKDDNIGFVQFHPSYDYTDFVEGLRPTDKDGNGNVGFERRDGVFKEFCEKALKNLVDSRKSVDVLQHERTINEIVEDFLNDAVEKKTQFETQTKNPFSVESFTDRKVFVSIPQNEKVKTLPIPIDDILELISNDVQLNIGKDVSEYFNRKWRTQQDSYIYVLTKQIQKNVKENKNNETVTMEKIQAKNFVFIIDEINRGEVAKIFGELFYSVDPGYRVSSGDLDAIKNGNKTVTTIKTQYANLETEGNEFDKALGTSDFGHFFIPENVYIIGTMNDIDRSVESMDFAFRRRFSWIEVKASDTVDMLDPKYDDNGELIAGLEKDLADEAKRRMENLNAAISKIEGLNDAYHIGASYFLKLNNYDGSQEKRFESLWNYHIKGILQEYLRGNPNAKEELTKLKAAYDREE